MRRSGLRAGAILLVLGGLVGGATVAVATPTPVDQCDGSMSDRDFQRCWFTVLDARLDRLESATPTPDPTPTATETPSATPTQTVTPSATPTPSPSADPSSSVTPTPTITPTPTPTPVGFPNADNTGVPAGTELTPYSGPMTITVAGTVIDSKTVTGGLTIRAANVVIRNSQINGTIANDENTSGTSFTVTDSRINAGAGMVTALGSRNFTATRVHITGGNRSSNCWMDCRIEASYVHGQAIPNGTTHQSGIRLGARSTLVGNTIACDAPDVPPDGGCSAAISGYGDFAQVKDVLVQGNNILPTTGGFCAYGGSTSGKPFPRADNVRYIGNTFGRRASSEKSPPTCGYYGTVTDYVAEPGSEFTGNKYTDGAVVNP